MDTNNLIVKNLKTFNKAYNNIFKIFNNSDNIYVDKDTYIKLLNEFVIAEHSMNSILFNIDNFIYLLESKNIDNPKNKNIISNIFILMLIFVMLILIYFL